MQDTVRFNVNGRDAGIDVAPGTPLLFVLRNDLGLRGTRHGCAEGECGACTVLLNGQPVTACNTPVEAAAGGRVETIEQLAHADPPHPLMEAIVAEQAGQCGYCLAGILMRAKALLHARAGDGRQLSRQEIADGLDAHLCRCGAHNRIIRAVQRAAVPGAGTLS